MAMNLMPSITALINKRQLKQSPDISSFAREGYEERHVGRVILGALPVRVEVDRPRVSTDRERVGGHVFAYPHSFRQRVSSDLELVRAVDGFSSGGRLRGR